MYGGLFGDLPATKNDAERTRTSCSNDGILSQGKADGSSRQLEKPSSICSDNNPSGAAIDNTAATKKQIATSSLVRNLGVAGTAMAFVPTAARRQLQKLPVKRSSSSTSNDNKTREDTIPEPLSKKIESENKNNIITGRSNNIDTISNKRLKGEEELNVPDSKSSAISWGEKDEEKANETHDKKSYDVKLNESDTNRSSMPSKDKETTEDDEEQKRQLQLQEQVKENPYDPMIPNDLLHYWEYKSMVKQRQELERERLETIQQQEALRLKLKRERENLVAQLSQTNSINNNGNDSEDNEKSITANDDHTINKNINSAFHEQKAIQEYEQKRTQALLLMSAGSGGGRGRGLSNLPAWMVQKIAKEKEQKLGDNT